MIDEDWDWRFRKYDKYDDSGNVIGWCSHDECSTDQFDSDGNKIGVCNYYFWLDKKEECFDLDGNLIESEEDKYSKYFVDYDMEYIDIYVPEDVEVTLTFVDGEAPVPTVFEVTSDS